LGIGAAGNDGPSANAHDILRVKSEPNWKNALSWVLDRLPPPWIKFVCTYIQRIEDRLDRSKRIRVRAGTSKQMTNANASGDKGLFLI
jgi:hypothetical protein